MGDYFNCFRLCALLQSHIPLSQHHVPYITLGSLNPLWIAGYEPDPQDRIHRLGNRGHDGRIGVDQILLSVLGVVGK